MPPVACSGWGVEGWQMLLAAPISPLVPELHSPIRPPMSPMPGTWHTPPGAEGLAGVMLAVSRAGVTGVAGAVVLAAAAWVPWGAWVAASAGVAIASSAAASSSTWMTQREMRWPGAGADELAIVRELLIFAVTRTLPALACWPRPSRPPGVHCPADPAHPRWDPCVQTGQAGWPWSGLGWYRSSPSARPKPGRPQFARLGRLDHGRCTRRCRASGARPCARRTARPRAAT